MASTRQLRGGDFVLRVDEEELDILVQGVRSITEQEPDFTQIPMQLREPIERSYHTWKKKLDALDAKLVNVTEPDVETEAVAPRMAEAREHAEA
jgi:hypothetical protein